VVTVFDAGDLGDGRFFIEMALCAEPDVGGAPGAFALGRSLRAYVVERGPLAPDDAARLLQPVCAAVAAAHRAGVVHSDVKPENVLVLPTSRRAMLADFGIAASLAAPRAQAAPSRVGTVPFMAPEQYQGRREPDAASDVYGLGGTLLFALSGSAPHPDRGDDGEDPRAGVPVAVPATVPPSLAELVRRALAHDPVARPTAEELARALDAFLARRPTLWELRRVGRRASLFYQRHSMLVNLGFVGAVLAATLGLGLLRTVVAKSGLEARARDLSRQVAALDADVQRLATQKGGLDAELARLRTEREAIAGSEAREREARIRAEGRSSEADAQLTATTAQVRETTGKLEGALANAAQLETRLNQAEARVRALEAEATALGGEERAAAERYRASVEALRQDREREGARLRQEVTREREAGAALLKQAADADRERRAAAESLARARGQLDTCRTERDDLQRRLDAARTGAGKAEDGAAKKAAAPSARAP
jgi:hypothetical protein